jgi:hypothetical protein
MHKPVLVAFSVAALAALCSAAEAADADRWRYGFFAAPKVHQFAKPYGDGPNAPAHSGRIERHTQYRNGEREVHAHPAGKPLAHEGVGAPAHQANRPPSGSDGRDRGDVQLRSLDWSDEN